MSKMPKTLLTNTQQNSLENEDFALPTPPITISNGVSKTAVGTLANLPRAEFPGELSIGDVTIPCAVLDDGTRVLTQQGFLTAIGRNRNPNKGQRSIDNRPSFLVAKNLDPFITDELRSLWLPIPFVPKAGGYEGVAWGYRAELLPKVCYVFLDAYEAGKLLPSQAHIPSQCRIIVRAFATLGIIALVDECTGYQEVRDRKALQAILDRYITDEWRAWSRQFPTEFYREVFRLRGWTFDSLSTKRPGVLSHITKDVVYSRLAPGVLKELQKKIPRNAKGKPTKRLFQGANRRYRYSVTKGTSFRCHCPYARFWQLEWIFTVFCNGLFPSLTVLCLSFLKKMNHKRFNPRRANARG